MAASLHFVLDSTIDTRSLALVKDALQRLGNLVAVGQPHQWNYTTTPRISVHHNRWDPEKAKFKLVQVYPAAENHCEAFGLRDFNHALSAVDLTQSAASLAQRLQRRLNTSPNSSLADVAPSNPYLLDPGRDPANSGQSSCVADNQMAFLTSLLQVSAKSNSGGSIVEEPEDGEPLPQVASSSASFPKLLSGTSCKVIFVCGSILHDPTDESFHAAVMEAATRCVSVDFLVVQSSTGKKPSHRMRSALDTDVPLLSPDGSIADGSGGVDSSPNGRVSRLEELEDAVSGYENCSLHCMPCDPVQLDAHTKRWLQHLHSCGADTTMDFSLHFKPPSARNKRAQGGGAGVAKAAAPLAITCSAYPTVLQLHDTIQPCLTCRCHGVPLPFSSSLPGTSKSSPPVARPSSPARALNKPASLRCPVSGQRLDASDVNSNAVMLGPLDSGRRRGSGGDGEAGTEGSRVSRENGGEEEAWKRGARVRSRGGKAGRDDMGESGGGRGTVLHLPSFKAALETPRLHGGGTPAVPLTVIKRVPLSSVSEGLIFGLPHVLMPSQNLELDFSNSTELSEMERNEHAFAALCRSLNEHDNGLLCYGLVDADTRMDISFPCYYLLLPTEAGSLLLRKVAAAEELLPLPPRPISNHGEEDEEKGAEVAAAVDAALSQLQEEAYNPVDMERGCHQRLHWLLKESLYFQPIAPGRQGSNLHSVSHDSRSSSRSPSSSSTSGSPGPGGLVPSLAATGRRERRRSASFVISTGGGAGSAAAAAAATAASGGSGRGGMPRPSMDLEGDSAREGTRNRAEAERYAAEEWRFRGAREPRTPHSHNFNSKQQSQPPQQQQMQKGQASNSRQAYSMQPGTTSAANPPAPRTTISSFQAPPANAPSSSPSHRKLFPFLNAPPRAPSPSRPSTSRFIITAASPPTPGNGAGRTAVEGALGRLEKAFGSGAVNGKDPATAVASAAVQAPGLLLSAVNSGSQCTPPPMAAVDSSPGDVAAGASAVHAPAAVGGNARFALHVPAGEDDEIEEGGSVEWAMELERLSNGSTKVMPGDRAAGHTGTHRPANGSSSSGTSRSSSGVVGSEGGEEEVREQVPRIDPQYRQIVQGLPELHLPPSTAQWPTNSTNPMNPRDAAAAVSNNPAPPAATFATSAMSAPTGFSQPFLPPALSAQGRVQQARRQAEAAPVPAPVPGPVPGPLQDHSNLQPQAQTALAVHRASQDKPAFPHAPRFASIPGLQRPGMGAGRFSRVSGAARSGVSWEGEKQTAKKGGGFRRIRQGKV